MMSAYNDLLNTNDSLLLTVSFSTNVHIDTTHLYVKIFPRDTTEYSYLINTSGLELFTYPLDYEIVQEGLYYCDPVGNAGGNTGTAGTACFYAVIPVEDVNKVTRMKYTILEYCYIPDENSHEAQSLGEDYVTTLMLLEAEALWTTNNLTFSDYQEAKSAALTRGSAHPTGYIRVKNTTTNNLEGVKKVKVRVHNIVKWSTTDTDETGYYKIPKSYRTNVHYAVIFENATGFKVWGNLAFLAPANYSLGWYSKSGHTRNIETNSNAWLWATVNNAAYIYREKMCPNLNITKPASNLRLWTVRMGGSWTGSAPMAKRFSLASGTLNQFLGVFSVTAQLAFIASVMPDVFIIKNFTTTKECYATVFHELSHASHYEKAGSGYWLNYIQGIIANGGYGNVNGTKAGYIGVGEMWGYYFGWRCMNNSAVLGYSFGTVNIDNTDWFKPKIMQDLQNNCGLTSKQIYDCLTNDVTSHALLKSKLISKYPSAQQGINSTFTSYGF
jgi:hypothetical protein